jgi:predicted RNA binding protein YcfA (HicA-like mRNA interferase family)
VSPRQPRITAAQLLRALTRDGWDQHHQTGSHLYLKHQTKPGMVTVARHAGVIIKPKTLAAILEQAGLTTDQLRNLL